MPFHKRGPPLLYAAMQPQCLSLRASRKRHIKQWFEPHNCCSNPVRSRSAFAPRPRLTWIEKVSLMKRAALERTYRYIWRHHPGQCDVAGVADDNLLHQWLDAVTNGEWLDGIYAYSRAN